MTHSFWQILAYALLPAATLLGGGAIASWRLPGPGWRSAILHFAGGVVFSVVAVELLPDVVRTHEPLEIVIGFGLGIGVMLALRRLTEQQRPAAEETAQGAGLPFGLLFGVGVDVVIDGLLLGIGFAAGAKEGVLLTLALTFELLTLGLATSATLSQGGTVRARTLLLLSGLALLFMAGGAAGGTLLQRISAHGLAMVLAFGLAALLFLVTEELLVEAHEAEETPWLTTAFFIGFLLFLVLGMLG